MGAPRLGAYNPPPPAPNNVIISVNSLNIDVIITSFFSGATVPGSFSLLYKYRTKYCFTKPDTI